MTDDYRGYRARFERAGQTVREQITLSTCPECGLPMEVRQTWRRGGDMKTMLYAILGFCPVAHKVERYGIGEPVDGAPPPAIVLSNPNSVQHLRR